MTTQVRPPIAAEVSTVEAHQSGVGSQARKLNGDQQKTLRNFMLAHKGSISPSGGDQSRIQATAHPQVSADEQVNAVTLSGQMGQKKRAQKSKYLSLYETLFTEDEGFLKLDLETFGNSLASGSREKPMISLVDRTTTLGFEDRQLRKYLLAKIGLNDSTISDEMRSRFNRFQESLGPEDLRYITESLIAFETGASITPSRLKIKLREFVKAYQELHIQVQSNESESKTTEVLDLFRMIKPKIRNEEFSKEFIKTLDGLFKVLTREKTQYPCKITSARQFRILARVKTLAVLTHLVTKHKQFYQFCKNAGFKGLPDMGSLIENSLQFMASGEAYAGINMLVQMASNIDSNRPHAKSTAMTIYRKMVLMDPQMHNLYWSAEIQMKLGDALDKAIKSSGIHSLAPAI